VLPISTLKALHFTHIYVFRMIRTIKVAISLDIISRLVFVMEMLGIMLFMLIKRCFNVNYYPNDQNLDYAGHQ
jgi:hypothetical protein